MTKPKNYPVQEEILETKGLQQDKEPILVDFLHTLTNEVTKARSLSTRIGFLVSTLNKFERHSDPYDPEETYGSSTFTTLLYSEIIQLKNVNHTFEAIADELERLIGDLSED